MGIDAQLYKTSKFLSWTRIHTPLGKSQVHDPITCLFKDESNNMQQGYYYYGRFRARAIYI
jgi:hypothetical protein